MPDFIKTPFEEKMWETAKKIHSDKSSKSEDKWNDKDWAIVNSLYQKVLKAKDKK